MLRNKIILVLSILGWTFSSNIISQNLVSTVHNLSISGPGDVKASSETELCIFCHTPHNSSPRAPLWNKSESGVNYTLYNSSSSEASIGQPEGSSILCLSCHDGTIALGSVLSRTSDIGFNSGITTMPVGTSNLSTDLSDDHPISFLYNSTLALSDGQLNDPSVVPNTITLVNNKLECISCHDPHKNDYSNFLVEDSRYSVLCIACHNKTNWNISSHKISTAVWNGSGINPWPRTDFSTVQENACENCHTPHSATGSERLLNYSAEEDNCTVCHNGNVASKDIQSEMLKPYSHNIYIYDQIHDISEDGLVNTKHVECQDCHNAHQVNSSDASAPNISGLLNGVKGVNTNGNSIEQIQYQYELCYRCHADSPDKPGSPTPREHEQNNVRLEFNINNPSFHPVEAVGANMDVRSLIAPYTESSIIYCSDCHSSNGVSAPSGPHGSIYPQILKYNYSKVYGLDESYSNYELCYQCHDRTQLLSTSSNYGRKVHNKHVVSGKIPCNECHDPHGISSSQGNSTNNTHLINFDLSVASSSGGLLEFIDLGSYSGRCYLVCHGRIHNPKFY